MKGLRVKQECVELEGENGVRRDIKGMVSTNTLTIAFTRKLAFVSRHILYTGYISDNNEISLRPVVRS